MSCCCCCCHWVSQCWSRMQRYCLLHRPTSWGCRIILYFMAWIDRFWVWLFHGTGDGGSRYLRRRQEVLGKHFCAFGTVVTCDYHQVSQFLSMPDQTRCNYWGIYTVRQQRQGRGRGLPRDFLWFLSTYDDEEEGQEVAGEGEEHYNNETTVEAASRHKRLHDYILQTIIIPAQTRISGPQKEIWQDYIDDFMEDYANMGFPRQLSKWAPELGQMTIRYIMHALFDMVVTDEQMKTLEQLFLDQTFLSSVAFPCCHCCCRDCCCCCFCCSGCCRPSAHSQVSKLVQTIVDTSPVLEQYVASHKNLFMTREEFAHYLLLLAGMGGISTSFELAKRTLRRIPPEYPMDLYDRSLLMRSVLEVIRLDTPVPSFTIVLPSPELFGDRYFPPGTPVTVCLAGAHHDEDVFPQPHLFDPKRPNLIQKTLGFHSIGFTPTAVILHENDEPSRSCMGRNIAMKMCTDLLIAKTLNTPHHDDDDNDDNSSMYGAISA